MRLFLQMVGGIALVAWLLFAKDRVSVKILPIAAVGVLFVVLYRILAARERRLVRKKIAERICTVSFVRPPRWNNRPVEEYVLRGPAVRALMAEHNQIALDAESALIRLGYRRRETRQAIEAGREEHGMHTYESLYQFALERLSGDYKNIYQIGDVRTVEGAIPNPAPRARAAGH
jgi:hypothetical protein